jgi:Holliday junction DNA helicase RuvA
MRVLGIDPGLTRCGMGVVEGTVGRPLTLVDVNVLRTSSDEPVAQRLVTIEKGIDAWLDEYTPDAVAVERVFARSDSSTIMGTAQASGIALVAAARRGIPVALHTPSEVKAAVSGSGRAAKAQVGAMVTRILRLDTRRRARPRHHPHLARRRTGPHRRRRDRSTGSSTGRPTSLSASRRTRRKEPGMIAFVRGEVAAVTLTSAVLEVGGVGLELMCTPGTLATLRHGQAATLPTSMVVREDSLTLFGFLDDDEKSTFELLQTASGVGPKLAQAMLAVLSPDDLRTAVAGDDVKTLTRVPGVGQKGAQRIILELRDRLGTPIGSSRSATLPHAAAPWRDQVHQGLVGLGWSARDAEKAVDSVAPEAGDAPDVGALLRSALRSLSKA